MHIDRWTLALQTVNVLVLIWLLHRFFFRPVADIVAKRQAETRQADRPTPRPRGSRRPTVERRSRHRRASNIARERDRLLGRGARRRRRPKRRIARQAPTTMPSSAAKRSGDRRANARGRAGGRRPTPRARRRHRAAPARTLPAAGCRLAGFLDGSCSDCASCRPRREAASPPVARTAHRRSSPPAPLPTDETAQFAGALRAALGARTHVRLSASIRPLIAGVELHVRITILRNIWRRP